MSEAVLDASAVLAYLNQEPGEEYVAGLLETGGAMISAVNYAEVAAKLLALGLPETDAAKVMQALEMEVIDLDRETAWISAQLVPITKPFGLSLGDRCCLALGQSKKLPVLTADKVWTELQSTINVRLIR